MSAAITQLEIALDIVTTNEPINRAEENVAQADLELANAADYKKAIEVLKKFEDLTK